MLAETLTGISSHGLGSFSLTYLNVALSVHVAGFNFYKNLETS